MKNVCLSHNCIRCCLNTQMLLTHSDIKKINALGFKNFFKVNKVGMSQLRNYKGKCTFHNGKICKIYDSRPTGCQLYPAVFDEFENKVVLDNHCPFREEFVLTSNIAKKVLKLLNDLDDTQGK
ncbi:YkgJ family cysteine cluster protein [[Eubacterium] cellulosolvens]